MKRISIFLTMAALLGAMVGCGPTPIQYELTITSTTGGSVTEPGEGTFAYDEGSVVNLMAEAEEGYWFVEWTGDTGTITNVNASSTTITLLADYSITASFQEDEVVQFADPNLEAVIREAIGKAEGDIYASELARLIHLSAVDRGIRDLSGIEYCTRLSEVILGPEVFATSLLRDYVTLTEEVSGEPNQISDLSPLAGCSNITYLNLMSNNITDISALAGLTNLTELYLGWNLIGDISPLANLTNLTHLDLHKNQTNDISALADLTGLTYVSLWQNQISDTSPLSGLTSLTYLCLSDNPIGGNISPVVNLTNLTALELVGNQISDISLLSGLTRLERLWLADNEISDISALANLTSLVGLSLDWNQISDISPLADLTNLTGWLGLSGNQIDDISLLAGLTDLADLNVGWNQISDVSPLASLTSLRQLAVYNNQISDISPLASLTSLWELDARANQISDILPLVDNPGLGAGDTVLLEDNPLSEDSINIYIPELEARGVNVYY